MMSFISGIRVEGEKKDIPGTSINTEIRPGAGDKLAKECSI